MKYTSHDMHMMLLTLSTCDPLDSYPPEEEHGGMMVDMQERDLVVLLSHNEKYLCGKGLSRMVTKTKTNN